MKWISVVACFVFIIGIAMVFNGQGATDMKAENREGLILYGLLFCAISCLWFVIHALTALLLAGRRKDGAGSDTT